MTATARMVTMSDVAKRAGVSRPTVSHVLNERREGNFVSEKTRERVEHAAREMGYKRNGSALAIKSGQFNSVSLLLSSDPFRSNLPSLMMSGIHDALDLHGFSLILHKLPNTTLADERRLPKVLREWMCDGLLIDVTHEIPPHLSRAIEEHNLPAIWINTKREYDCVYPDDFEAGWRVGNYLAQQGHRHVGWTSYTSGERRPEIHYSAYDRRDGVRQGVEEQGGRLTEYDGMDDFTPFVRQTEIWHERLARPDRPTALVGYGAPHLEPALRAAEKMGIAVPAQLAALTFGSGNEQIAGLPVTASVVPDKEIGQRAVRLLLSKIETSKRKVKPVAVRFAFQPHL